MLPECSAMENQHSVKSVNWTNQQQNGM